MSDSNSRRKRGPGEHPRRARAASIIRGLLLLGRGRAEGFDCFDGGRDGFLAGLSPPIGFLLVLSALLLAQHPSITNLSLIVVLFCAVLLPPVLSHAMATIWRRTENWTRYATASIWSGWLVLPLYIPAMLLVSVLLQLGVSRAVASNVIMLLLVGYFLWLQWFLAWKGLAISRFRAVLTVIVLTLGSGILVTLAQLLPPHLPMVSMPQSP